MGPVIDQASFNKIMDYIEIGKEEGRLVSGGKGDDSKGYSSGCLTLMNPSGLLSESPSDP